MIMIVIVILILVLTGAGAAISFALRGGESSGAPGDVDCVVSEWGACSQSGLRYKSVLIGQKGDGEECPVLKQACQPPPIPNTDCVTGEWGKCSPTTKTRNKNILTQQSGDGEECGVLSEDCIPDIDCELSGWSDCKAVDSHQKYQQVRTITTEKSGNGAECPSERSKDCTMIKDYEHFPQYDYGGNDIRSFNSGSWGTCKDECDKYKDCVAFNHNMSDGSCNIKSAAKSGVVNHAYDTWVKSGTQREGSPVLPVTTKGSMTGVKIKNANGKCLEADHPENGAWSRLRECKDDKSQKWDYNFDTKQLKSQIRTGGNACLKMEGANHSWKEPYLQDCDNSVEQKWSYDDNTKKIKRYSTEGNEGQCLAANDVAFRWGCTSGDLAQEFTME